MARSSRRKFLSRSALGLMGAVVLALLPAAWTSASAHPPATAAVPTPGVLSIPAYAGPMDCVPAA